MVAGLLERRHFITEQNNCQSGPIVRESAIESQRLEGSGG
jgi:hypothetical protein